jgi:hypothetical protein
VCVCVRACVCGSMHLLHLDVVDTELMLLFVGFIRLYTLKGLESVQVIDLFA